MQNPGSQQIYRLSAVRISGFLTQDAMATNPTGFSAPASEQTDDSMVNLSSSSGYTVLQTAPTKKHRLTTTERVEAPLAKARVPSVSETAAVPAMVATSQNVELHNASQAIHSSGSDASLISSIERHRRYDLARAQRELAEQRVLEAEELARAKRELAEARVAEAQSRLDLSAGSRAGSIGRLDDVTSEVGSGSNAARTTDVGAPLAKARAHHAAALHPPDHFDLPDANVVRELQPTDTTTQSMVYSSERLVPMEVVTTGVISSERLGPPEVEMIDVRPIPEHAP